LHAKRPLKKLKITLAPVAGSYEKNSNLLDAVTMFFTECNKNAYFSEIVLCHSNTVAVVKAAGLAMRIYSLAKIKSESE
jgi:hypothetical protein